MGDATLQRQAQEELKRRVATERGRYYTPNGGIERFLVKIGREIPVGSKKIHVVILRAGNGLGKTCLAANLASYLTNRYPNRYLDKIPFLKDYRRPNRGRILTTATAAETAYDEELSKWLPAGRYRSSKGGHKFKQKYEMLNDGSIFDILTFKQDPSEAESATLDWAIADEPMPFAHWKALKMRFRFGGVVFLLLTALEGAEWYEEIFETPERLGRDVHRMQLSSEENCIQHGIRGIVEHETLESQWEDLDDQDLLARRDGGYFKASGTIYPTYSDDVWDSDPNGRIAGHVMKGLTGYYWNCYQEGKYTLYNVVDPHDRKPFAIGWYMVFPNDKGIVVAEWPDDSMKPFHKIKSWPWDVETYARMIKATEKEQFGRAADIRIIDPNFGNAIKGTSKTTVIADFKTAGEMPEIRWPLKYYGEVSDAIVEGHIAVRSLLGNPGRDVAPDFFVLDHCLNHRHGFKNYAYKENQDESKGLSEAPQFKLKDFMDLPRYLANYGMRYIKRIDRSDPELQAAERRRKGKFKPVIVKATGFRGMA